jgi:SHS2 domain-containing protein
LALQSHTPSGNHPSPRRVQKKYEYIDEVAPSDCAFRAFGETLEELFSNAGLAVTNCMVDLDSIDAAEKREIDLQAESPSDLLYNWLEEIIYIKDAELLFLKEFDIKLSGDSKVLKAIARGEKINREKHRIFTDIKAVTMHRFALEKAGEGWEAFIVLDL